MSICYWDETVHGGGTKAWKYKYRGPPVQAGTQRGREWIASGPWVPPGGTDANGVIIECFAAWTDYRFNPGSLGGQLFLMRCWRDSASDMWKLDDPIFLYEDVISGPRNGSYMHFHTAGITFPGGGTSGRRMVVTLSVGDSAPNNRTVNIAREDFREYKEGWTSLTQTTATAGTPSPEDEVPPDVVTQNGWTTYEDREGQRLRIQFSRALYDAGPPAKLTSLEFEDYTQPTGGGVTPIVITSGFATVPVTAGIVSKDTSGVTTVVLNRPLGTLTGDVVGYVWSDASIQGMLQMPQAVTGNAVERRSSVILGGDEQGNSIVKYTISGDGSGRINPEIVHGVMTDSVESDYFGGGNNLNLGWLTFLGAARAKSSVSDFTTDAFIALVAPNSRPPWNTEGRAVTLAASLDGDAWGDLFAPNSTTQVPSAFFGNDVFLGRADGSGLFSIPAPSSETSRLWRPISISGGATNYLKVVDDAIALDTSNPPVGPNTVTRVLRSELGTGDYANVPLPPTMGPIMRIKSVDNGYASVWKLTDLLSLVGGINARGKLWIYRLFANSSGDVNSMPPCSSAAISFRIGLVPSDKNYYNTDLLHTNRFEGSGVPATGWTPMTFSFAFTPIIPFRANYALLAEMSTQNGSFSRQDVLVAWDHVVADANILDLPVRPLLSDSSPVSSLPESITLSYAFTPPLPETWSVFAALRIPDSAPDEFSGMRAINPTNVTVLTLWESNTKFLRIVLDRGTSHTPSAASSIKIIDHNGSIATIEGPVVNEKDGDGPGDPAIPFAQPFFFLRGRQVLIGLSRVADGETYFYRVWASVGGTRAKVAEFTSEIARVIPKRINSGDPNKASIDPIEIFGIWSDDANSTSRDEGRTKLRTLSFLS